MYVQPRPDETSYSLLTRAHLQSVNANPANSLETITGVRGYKPLSGLPTRSFEIIKNLKLPLTIDDWINKHTLYPLFRPFIPANRITFIRESIEQSGASKSRIGLLRSHCGAHEQRAYCSHCNALAISHYGHAYWSRSHALKGVAICIRHAQPLHTICANNLAWKDRALVMPERGHELQIDDEQESALLFISEQVGKVINDTSGVHIRHEMYVDALRAAGLYTQKGRIRGRRLTSAIRRWLAPISRVEPFDELLRSLNVERNWATIAIACEGGFTHPLKHVVIWGAIGCCWNDLVNAAFAKGHQLDLALDFSTEQPPSDAIVLKTLHRAGSLTASAKELGCDVTTMAVWADRLGYERTRKPKKVTSKLRIRIVRAVEMGESSADIARQFSLSVTTINRIKRSLRV